MGGVSTRERSRIWLATLGLIPATIGFAWGVSQLHRENKWQSVPSGRTPGPISFEVELPTALSKIRDGRRIWIHFFGATCGCSSRRLSQTMAYERRYGDKFQVIAIHVGSSSTKIEDQPRGLRWRTEVIADPNAAIAKSLGVVSTPQAVVLDADSRLLFRGNYGGSDGLHESVPQFDNAMKAILAGELPPQGLEGLGCPVDGGETQ